MKETSDENEPPLNGELLSQFIAKNTVPCFAYVNTDEEKASKELVYFYKEFNSKCLLAKSYSNMLESYLLHHRPSYVGSEIDSSLTKHSTVSAKFVFNDIVTIPFNYPGLFEVFSSNSVKTGGILDHETDLVSFASRLHKSKTYYVAKEMKVYELISNNSHVVQTSAHGTAIINKKNLSRKWVRIEKGSVCKAVKLVSVDYTSEKSDSYLHMLKQILCCNFGKSTTKKNSDIAIEFKMVKDMSDLKREQNHVSSSIDGGDSSDIDEVASKIGQDLPKAIPSEKTYFLPVYESNLNNEIDLIPISSVIKNNRFKTNNLHLIKNFVLNDDLLINNYTELKLFDENPFDKLTTTTTSTKPNASKAKLDDHIVRDNQHLEMDKYVSIFDLVEFRLKCELVIGFNLNKNSIFIIPTKPLCDSDNNLSISRVSVMERQTNQLIQEFLSGNNMEKFVRYAQNEIDSFDRCINRIETFKMSSLFGTFKLETNNPKFSVAKLKAIPTITHFSDLVNADSGNVSIFELNENRMSTEKPYFHLNRQTKKTNYMTLPWNNLIKAGLIFEGNLNFKLRSNSLPVNKFKELISIN